MNIPGRTSQLRSVLVAALAGVSALVLTGTACAQQPRNPALAVVAEVGGTLTGRVSHVYDGDTLELALPDGRRVRIRLDGIDCPERGRPYSNVARNFTRQLAFDKQVTARVVDIDRHGRLVARVTSEGKDVSWELVNAGLAWHYTRYANDPKLAAAEADARRNRRGMWRDGSVRPESPLEERGQRQRSRRR
ncbi:MAG TPA: thermonuclease family protein [Vicinamibacterales bacterium]|nr:thermonuclease family protein [Vicinamibacterales bacterium]